MHLNFIEGHCAARPEEVRHLTDKQGYFNITWGDLFRWNYSPKMFMTIKKELKAEIKAQTELFREQFGEDMPCLLYTSIYSIKKMILLKIFFPDSA